MVGQQQNIFELQSLEATKWLAHRKILLTDIKSAIVSMFQDLGVSGQ
jgi:hypothetical protein